jgi:hypothetical protein
MGMAMQVAGPTGGREVSTFLKIFGQSDRNTPPATSAGSLLHPLALMQSPVVTDRVLAKNDSLVERLLASYSDDRRLVDELFLGTIARSPTDNEREVSLAALRLDRVAGAQNLQWALINSQEFFFNY